MQSGDELVRCPGQGFVSVVGGVGGPPAPEPAPIYHRIEQEQQHGDPRRGKGKRGGLRVIYYWWDGGRQFWLFTLYDKDEMENLSADEKKLLKGMLKAELEARR